MITSPNVEFVPLPIWGTIKLRMRADGRFGIHDPVNCPQMFLYKHGHLAALLRKPDDLHDPIACMWRVPKPIDFMPVDGARTSAFGTLAPAALQPISVCIHQLSNDVRTYLRAHPQTEHLPILLVCMMDCLARLQFPSTFRDLIRQVASVQRTWLECRAYLDWVGSFIPLLGKHSADKPAPLKANRMGAFSTEPTVVQKLLAIGLPVWFVRRSDQLPSTVVIKRMVTAANTAVIEMGLGPFPTEPIYHGLAGTEQHFSVLWRSTSHMLDIEHVLISDGFVEEAEGTVGRTAARSSSSSSFPPSLPGVVRSTHSHTKDCPCMS